MKRLLIYLGLLATLLAMPYHAKADNTWAYYLYGSFNNWAHEPSSDYKFGETSNGSDQDHPSWTKTFTGAQLDPDGNGVAYFKILLVEKNGTTTTTTNLGPSGGNQVLEVNGSAQTLHLNNSGDGAYMVTGINKDAEYTIMYVSTTRNGGTISITGPDTENKNIKLRGSYSNDNWATSTAYTFSDGIYTWEFDKSGFPSGTKFKLFEYVDGTNDLWYGNGKEVTEDWSNEFSNGGDMSVSYNDELIKISVQAKKSNGKWMIRIVKTYEPHDYYWVSPQVTNNQKWPYFKLTALRDRSGSFGDGKISDKYFTFTIKNDDLRRYDHRTAIDDGEKIEWYIARDDDAVWFRPSTDNPTPTESNTSLNIGNSEGYDDNIGYRNFNDCKVYDATNTHMFAFNKGANSTNTSDTDYKNTVKSYTFILNSRKSNDDTKGNVYFNYAHNDSPVTTGDCYLLGNFKSASETEYVCNPGEAVYPGNTYGPRKMTKYWYVGSTKYESEHNPCDSIVYEIKVDKPTAGWGNLYLDINPGSNTSWDKVYRPLISLGNTLDGRALIGGLTTAGAGMDNNVGDQSLNPETSNDYTSYTLRFNATTYTYQLEFHTSLYLVGLGVSATEGKQGSWDLSNVTSFDPRIRLTATQEKDHYRNRVYFTQGQPFRFIKNIDESATPTYENSWMENDYAPKWEGASADGDYYPYNATQLQYETQYKNYLSTGSTVPSDNDNSILFDLPTGWYYVNFYPNADKPYYTIEHSMELRDFNEVYYRTAGIAEKRNVQGRNDYNFLRVWSDHIAWNKPDDIDVFVVSAFDRNTETHETTATLKKLDGNYIPANTGVILGCKLSKNNLTSGLVYDNAATLAYGKGENVNYYNTLTAELTPYSDPSTTSLEESKLIPLYKETSLQRFSDDTGIGTGDGYANYLFGFYRCKKYKQNYSGKDNDFDMGFWLTTGIGQTYANSAFLHLTKEEAEDLGVGTAYPTANDTSASRASAPAFMLLFDESDDNVITGISDITTAKGNSVASQGWYTLQGVRTPKPTQRGIYIYNGKKVIVND
jgi:hypothetical protein